MSMHKVRVSVGKRDGFKGVWGAGMFWPEGLTEKMVDADVARRLLARKDMIVSDDGPVGTSAAAPVSQGATQGQTQGQASEGDEDQFPFRTSADPKKNQTKQK